MVYFDGKAADGWKFCGTEDWSTDNWGAPESMTPEQSPVTLVSGNGGDIKAYSKNSYYLEFNNTTGELKVSKPHNSWGIVGDHNSWGSGDTMMTLETETDENNKFQYYLKATLDMSAGNKWKIRPEEKWEDDIAPGAVEGEFEDAGDGNFKVSEAGNYTIKWYFNKVTPKIIVVKTDKTVFLRLFLMRLCQYFDTTSSLLYADVLVLCKKTLTIQQQRLSLRHEIQRHTTVYDKGYWRYQNTGIE